MTRNHPAPISRNSPSRRAGCALAAVTLLAAAAQAQGQVSLATAVDLALTHSPKLRMAQADVDKARAALKQAKDVYIPSVGVGTGAGGDAWGYSPNPPALFTFSAQSLVFNYAQRDYIRAGRFGLNASELLLLDARQTVIEDTALNFLSLQHHQQREGLLRQENELAQRLVAIVEDRVSAGRDSAIDLTTVRLTAAQFRLAALRAEDETANDRDHLALCMGMSATPSLTAEGPVPPVPEVAAPAPATAFDPLPVVSAAYARAAAREATAKGDRHYVLWPQFSFGAQYNRYATFTGSIGTLGAIQGTTIGLNEGGLGVEVQIPLFDQLHKAKADESDADARRARAEADDAQRTALDGQLRLRHSVEVLKAQSEVARLEQQLAQQQLDALTLQLNTASANPSGPPLSPEDEQNSRIAERQKQLALIDAEYQLREAQIQLLRQTGQLESWLRQSMQSSAPPKP